MLFAPDLPEGLVYKEHFLSPDEEAALAAEIDRRVEFQTFEMRGVVARRRVAFFGLSYDEGRTETPPIPDFLLPLRDRVAEWIDVDPSGLVMALINQYPPGAPIGWHRDAPQYDKVAGISLLSACRMVLRPYVPPRVHAAGTSTRRQATHELRLERGSAYLLSGPSRSAYEHHIPPVDSLRYSITFRTLRQNYRSGKRARGASPNA